MRIPVGTISIDKYLDHDRIPVDALDGLNASLPILWPSLAEWQRYAAVLYIEKEGFEPLLQAAKIAERFDLAILSCKGQSVVAARKLVDHVCSVGGGVPLFIVHDFDKSGFEIAECLTHESQLAEDTNRVAYRFENDINVIDFGLRLEDVQRYDLESESCKVSRKWPTSLTAAERKFLSAGRRVELNAFTAPQLIEWLEGKLRQHLPQRLIPNNAILGQAYRRDLAVSRINRELERILEDAISEATDATVPKSLRKKLEAHMEATGQPWDAALYSMIVDGEEGDD